MNSSTIIKIEFAEFPEFNHNQSNDQENFFTEGNFYKQTKLFIENKRTEIDKKKWKRVVCDALERQFRFLHNFYDARNNPKYTHTQQQWCRNQDAWIKNEIKYCRELEVILQQKPYKAFEFEYGLKQREQDEVARIAAERKKEAELREAALKKATQEAQASQAKFTAGFDFYRTEFDFTFNANNFNSTSSSRSSYEDTFVRICKNIEGLDEKTLAPLLTPENLHKKINGKDLLRYIMGIRRLHPLFDMVLAKYKALKISLEEVYKPTANDCSLETVALTKYQYAYREYIEHLNNQKKSPLMYPSDQKITYLGFAVKLLVAGAAGNPQHSLNLLEDTEVSVYFSIIQPLLELPNTKLICNNRPLICWYVSNAFDSSALELDTILRIYKEKNVNIHKVFDNNQQSPIDIVIEKSKWQIAIKLGIAGIGNLSHAQKIVESIPVYFKQSISSKELERLAILLQRPGLKFSWTATHPDSKDAYVFHLLPAIAESRNVANFNTIINAYVNQAAAQGVKPNLDVTDHKGFTAFDYAVQYRTQDGYMKSDFSAAIKLLENGAKMTVTGLLDFLRNFYLSDMQAGIIALAKLHTYPFDEMSTYKGKHFLYDATLEKILATHPQLKTLHADFEKRYNAKPVVVPSSSSVSSAMRASLFSQSTPAPAAPTPQQFNNFSQPTTVSNKLKMVGLDKINVLSDGDNLWMNLQFMNKAHALAFKKQYDTQVLSQCKFEMLYFPYVGREIHLEVNVKQKDLFKACNSAVIINELKQYLDFEQVSITHVNMLAEPAAAQQSAPQFRR